MARPKLRFQEFTDEWENNGLDQLVHFSKGAILSKADIDELGEIPCILYGQLYTKYGEIADVIFSRTNCNKEKLVYSEEKDVIMPISGETPEDISTATCIMKSGIALGGDLLILRSDMLDGRFLSYYLNYPLKYRIAGIAQGKSIVHIGERSLKTLDMCYPTLGEQRKIIDFLSSVQDIIQVQEEEISVLEEQKKGVMQKLFNREVRFIADDGSEYPEWEEKFLGDLFDISAGGDIDKAHSADYETEEYCYPVFANALANNGLYGYADYYKVSGDTITVTGRGDVGHAVARHCAYVPIVRLLVLAPIYKENVDFFAYQINLKNIFIESTGVPQLTSPQLKKMKIECPDFEEQQKIADCLLAYEEVIQIKKEKLEIWKKIKKGLLQQMFV